MMQIKHGNILKKVQVKQQQKSKKKENQWQNRGSIGLVKKQSKAENQQDGNGWMTLVMKLSGQDSKLAKEKLTY